MKTIFSNIGADIRTLPHPTISRDEITTITPRGFAAKIKPKTSSMLVQNHSNTSYIIYIMNNLKLKNKSLTHSK